MKITITYGGRIQTRKLPKVTSVSKAISLLWTLFEADELGCEEFVLWDENDNVIYAIE